MVRRLIERLRSDGFDIRVEDGNLVVSPWSRLPETTRAELTSRKPAVLAFLLSEPPEGGRLLNGGVRWIPAPERPGWCPCDEAEADDPATGLCWTCYGAVFGKKIRPPCEGGDR